MQHLLRSTDFNSEELRDLLRRAAEFLPVVQRREALELAKGTVLATLFYEPSTRTRFSFETAMHRLGGAVISNPQMLSTSSAKKGETLYDTGKVVSQFANVIVMRHPEAGSVAELARGSEVPVINGGDGAADHPTQGLLDVFTIQEKLGRVEGLTIVMVGDLKYGRVVHSQCEWLSNFADVHFVFVSPEALRMPAEIVAMLRDKGFEVTETDDLDSVIGDCDVLSQTRIQKERFESEAEYLKYKGVYVITPELMQRAKQEMIVIHPLPRVDEIDAAVDTDARAVYFDQVQNGVAMRMALLAKFLNL